MSGVNFEFIIWYLQKEIERLNESNGSDAIDAVKKGMLEFLTQLLDWMKTAIRVERDRIQGARDSIDATMYALLSKSNIRLDPSLTREITSKDCELMASKVEDIRLALKSRRADTTSEKMKFVRQDEVLSKASDMLTKISEEKSKTM